MDNQGLNNDVLVGGRKFHVQTEYMSQTNRISGKVFNDGEVIDALDVDVDASVSAEEARQRVEEVHQRLITEMEVLYYIYEKVKTVMHAPSANKLGLLFLQRKLVKEAIEQFELALRIDANYADALTNLGKAHLIREAYDDAVEVLARGVQTAPEYADLRNYLGIAYLYREEYDKAIEQLEAAIRLNPNYIGAQYHLGIAMLARIADNPDNGFGNGLDEALAALNQAKEKAVNRDIPKFNEVIKLVDEQAYTAAVDEFLLTKPRDTIRHFSDIETEFYLKFMYGGKGKDDVFISEYVDRLREILEEHPDYADVRNNLGVANLIQCRNLFLKSLEEFRAALKINPNYKKAEKNLKLAENDGKGFLILLRAILR